MGTEEEVRRVLEAIDAETEGKPPAERVRLRNAVAEAAAAERRRRNQEDVREMHESGMTYREIASAIGVSFGRVRQILTEELDDEGNLKSE
ncbi:helix-turn-helix domain-containing protein [Streptomonospora algeriensis]|uniref:Helix-turn-helix domain-containing protein n=1 Tax=Streptomonospora algeriensis TaxID=995084 RepID=A0ABW3BC81_9ACTN